MLATLAFSLIGTMVFVLIAVGLVYLMAALGDGQRIHLGGRPQAAGGTQRQRPRRNRR